MSTTKPRTRLSPAERATQIQDAALAIALEDGLSALTLRAVATRAHVASGLITHYEPSIEVLIARTFSTISSAELNELHELTAQHDTALERMRALIETLLSGEREQVTLAWVEAYALGRRNPALAEAVHEQMQTWMRFVATIIRDGAAEGAFAVRNADDAAWQLIGMIDGLNAQALLRRADEPPYAAQMARASETILGATQGLLTQAG